VLGFIDKLVDLNENDKRLAKARDDILKLLDNIELEVELLVKE
jgi:hypothetical protein